MLSASSSPGPSGMKKKIHAYDGQANSLSGGGVQYANPIQPVIMLHRIQRFVMKHVTYRRIVVQQRYGASRSPILVLMATKLAHLGRFNLRIKMKPK